MRTYACGLLALLAGVCPPADASSIARLDWAAMEQKSALVVMGVVTELTASDDYSDTVSVQVVAALKGKTEEKAFSLRLRNKGVKDFDPTLKAGDRCVFFLGGITGGKAELAYWGSIAVMPKGMNFSVGGK